MQTRKKILYVDDDERTLNIVSKHLLSKGYKVFTSSSPFVATLLAREKPDLIILDITMPLLSGDRIAEVLKQQGYTEDVPIIFFSGEPPDVVGPVSEKFPTTTLVKKQSGLDSLVEKIRLLLS